MAGEQKTELQRRRSEFGSLLNIAAGVLITFALTTHGATPQLFVVAAVLAAAAMVPCAMVGRIFSIVLLALALFFALNVDHPR